MKKNNTQSQEFVTVDFDEVMTDTKILGNTEIMKNFASIKDIANKNKAVKDILPKPLVEDANSYNFYVILHKNDAMDEMKSWLAQAIEWKIKSPYTHALVSLDINMESALGMIAGGLTREFPEYYAFKSFKFKCKRNYDVFAYKLSKEEYKEGRKLFSNYIININKYSYDLLGLVKPLIYKLDSSKMPIGENKKEADIESYFKKTSFICSTFALYMLTSISKKANAWYHEMVKKNNLITSCFNPASLSNMEGLQFIFNVPPNKSFEEVKNAYIKSHKVNN